MSDGRVSSGGSSQSVTPQMGQNYDNDDVIIKVEPLEYDDLQETGPVATTSIGKERTVKVQPVQALQAAYPSMVPTTFGRFGDESQNREIEQRSASLSQVHDKSGTSLTQMHDKSGYEKFTNQVLAAIKLEYPNAREDECYEIAMRRWNQLSEEQRRTFSMKGMHAGQKEGNFQSGKLRGIHYDVDDIEEQGIGNNHRPNESSKFGRCTWCKNFGNLNDYTSNLQGREIYCTGLCSKECFEQAAQKILNVETGYGLVSAVYPETSPIHANINLDRLNAEPPSGKDIQQSHMVRPQFDATRQHGQSNVSRPHVEIHRPRHVATRPPSNPSQNANIGRASQWNIENVQSLSSGEHIRASTTDPSYSIAENVFDWNDYLKRTNAVAAPITCFKQHRTPQQNQFKVRMKLEAEDPKQESTVSIATVITVLGPRVRLRFDGCNKPEDVWQLVDSKKIHPVGWCEGNGGILKQPTGFSVDVGTYTEFLQKTLRNAELAPMNAFKTEPAAPKDNKFIVGMKLEAVDKNNPALIGVSTITEVEGEKIKVEFDGYKRTGYWTVYHDRDLFQVGWCYANGYPLQPPGGGRILRPEPQLPSNEIASSRLSPSSREKRAFQPTTEPRVTGHGDVDVHINVECNPGPYLNSEKVAAIPSTYKGDISVVMKTILEDFIRCAYDPKTVLGFLKPGRGNISINAVSDGVVFNCYLSNIERVSTFWQIMEQFCDNLRCCSNMISGFELQTVCPQCGRGPPSKRGSANSAKRTYEMQGATKDSNSMVCISSTPDSTGMNTGETFESRREVARESPKRRRDESVVSQVTTSPRSWSVDDVAKFIEKTDLKDLAALFQDNDIDGKALLLLKRDIIINYMGLKIGPAVKLLDLIDELKDLDTRLR